MSFGTTWGWCCCRRRQAECCCCIQTAATALDGAEGWFGSQACSGPATTSGARTSAWAPISAFRSQAQHLGVTTGMCWSPVLGAWLNMFAALNVWCFTCMVLYMFEAPWIGSGTSCTALAISRLPVACPRLSTTPLRLPVTLLMPVSRLPVPLSEAETDVDQNS